MREHSDVILKESEVMREDDESMICRMMELERIDI